MNNFSDLDIINSKGWTESKWLSYFQDRLGKMEAGRSPHDERFDLYDTQVNALSYYDNQGQLQVNIPLEKTLTEVYEGRTDGKIKYDIVPDGQTDIAQLQPSKFALNFFLDGNGKNNFWKQDKLMRKGKSHYGSGILYTGLRKIIDFNYELKDDIDISNNENLLDENNFNEIRNETWEFFPENINIRDFYIDDGALGNPDIQKAQDCIYKEKLTSTELQLRYGNNKTFNIKNVQYGLDPQPQNSESEGIEMNHIIIYHYFHRLTKKYIIVANRDTVIFSGKYLYNDGKLPFENIQHYTNINRFYGEGIPERVGYLKAYKSEIFQDILTGASMANGVNLLIGNDDELGQDWEIGGRQLNLWRTTGGADRVQQVQTNINLGFFTAILDLLERQITIDSGINPLEQFDPLADKVGIAEIMEANKAIRNKSVDSNYDIGLDTVLTMTLSRIQQFAPSLLSTTILDSDGKVIKTMFPLIRIDGYKVEKKQGQQIFTENIGKYGYFELKPGVVQGIGVKIITSSTNSMLPILERQKITDYLTNVTKLANIASLDQTGGMMDKLKDFVRFDELLGWISDSYGYDINGLKANTEKDEISKRNLAKIEEIKKFILSSNENNNEINTGIPGQNIQQEENMNIKEGNSEINQGAGVL